MILSYYYRIANCAALFWVQNVDTLQRKDQLEVGCMQYFHLLEQHPEVKRFFAKDKIEETALRYILIIFCYLSYLKRYVNDT